MAVNTAAKTSISSGMKNGSFKLSLLEANFRNRELFGNSNICIILNAALRFQTLVLIILLVLWGSLHAEFIKREQFPMPVSGRLNWPLRWKKKSIC